MEKSEIKSFHNIIYNIDTAAHWTDRNFLGMTLLLPDMLQTNWATDLCFSRFINKILQL